MDIIYRLEEIFFIGAFLLLNVFSEITAFQQTQTRIILTGFKLFLSYLLSLLQYTKNHKIYIKNTLI